MMDKNLLNQVIYDTINPKLREHKGWIELEDAVDGTAIIRFRGACAGCDGTKQTLTEFVIPTLLDNVPGLVDVQVNDGTPQELYEFARSLFSSKELSRN